MVIGLSGDCDEWYFRDDRNYGLKQNQVVPSLAGLLDFGIPILPPS